MKLDKEIFNSLRGKAAEIFYQEVRTYIEIGVREGNTFNYRVPLIKEKAVALDCWDLFEKASQNDMGRTKTDARLQFENLYNKYKDNDNVDVIRSFSNDLSVINSYADSYFDVIFIDGDHSYDGVKEDLNNWWKKCNTLFCGHDYMLTKTVWSGVECGVKSAVDEFVSEHLDEILEFRVYEDSPNPTWFIWKK